MAGATIGSLHVSLGMDSAQFSAGLAKAQGSLGKFSKIAGVSFAAVAAAGIAAGTALAFAVKGAADHADALSKTAQKVGVATEALSRLKYAADFSDVSLEQLSGGLGRLSKNMLDVASGAKGPAATAFAALGVSITDASGQLRASDQVFADIADKLSRMEDGSLKVALAQRIFGKSGAELIPLLNEGAAGLKRFADESDRTGNTISTHTGKAAEQFNDTLALVGKTLDGVAIRVMESALPALQDLASTMAAPEMGQAAQFMAGGIIGAINLVINSFANAIHWAGQLRDAMAKNEGNIGFGGTLFGDPFGVGGTEPSPSDGVGTGAGSFGGMQALMGVDIPKITIDLGAFGEAAGAAATAIDPLAARMGELSGVLTQTHDPFEQMKLDLTDLATLWENGRISAEQYHQAVNATTMGTAAATLGMVGELTGAFATLFKDNKAFAVANAVINTAEGITKALAQGGMFGFASAAAIGIAGAAQIGTIMASNPGSSNAPSVGSSAAPAVQDTTSPAAGSGTAINIHLKGRSYSREDIRELLENIGEYTSDGSAINVSFT